MYSQKFSFFIHSLLGVFDRDSSCPSCGSLNTSLIRRKMVVVSLRECLECGLRFRMPKDRPESSIQFYQSEYDAGFTTLLPSEDELAQLLSTGFKNGEKDFSRYLEVLDAVGIQPGDKVLDFGSSWGYGSWQLQQAGYDVYSYEVSKIRSDYAKNKLGCKTVDDIGALSGKMHCVFSSHVLEHLPDPNIFWEITDQVLMPGGKIVSFVPSGEPSLEQAYGRKRYHQLWGQVHPLLFTRKALNSMAGRHQYKAHVYSYPCPLEDIRDLKPVETNGKELLLIADRLSGA